MKGKFVFLIIVLCELSALAQGPSVLAPSGATSPGGPDPTTLPQQLRGVGVDQHLNRQLSLDLNFRDEVGRVVPLKTFFGKRPVVLSLVYYDCPMLCTMVLNGLVRALRTLKFDPGREFELVTVSFDPTETPVLAAAKKDVYLRNYGRAGAANGWHFLTGEESAIRQLTSEVGFRYTYDEKTRQFAHASALIVLTPDGHIARYFYGIEYSGRDLRLGLVEAAAGKIGTAVDQVLLYCFHYDPATGKYGLAALNAVRAGGVLTALAMLCYMCFMFAQDAKKKRVNARGLGVKI